MNISALKEAVKKADPKLKEEDESFMAAVIMLAPTETNTFDPDELARLLKYRRGFVRFVSSNLVKNGVWKNGKINHSGWFDKESGGVAFWLDTAIGMGYVARCRGSEPVSRKINI